MTSINEFLAHLANVILNYVRSNSTITYAWSSATVFFGALTLRDWGFIIGVAVGVLYTIKNYRINKKQRENTIRRDNERAEQIARQTDLIEQYLEYAKENNINPSNPMKTVDEVINRCEIEKVVKKVADNE